MSAIAGIHLLDKRPLDPADLKRMLKAVAHRGPNGSGLWFRGSVGLGHRLLWTTPESLREKLPLTNETGDLVVTADARIDNREELIGALELKGRPHGEITDAELILLAYERWGNSCPEKLLGDFAFAIWDGRKQTLFCARDHFGVKPFYYYCSDRAFIFGSEIKALVCVDEVPRRLNEVRVADYLVSILEDKAVTFYQNILRLPPGHFMTIGENSVAPQPYWILEAKSEIRLGSDEEYAEEFRRLFAEAVRCRLRSAFSVGSMLSGGLDSSSIVCMARALLEEKPDPRLHTFSAIFDDVPECDERPFINAVLAGGGLEPHFVRADQLSPLNDLDRVLWHEDEPFYGPNLFIHWALYHAAYSNGVPILLDGIDGDTTLWQRLTYLTDLVRTARWGVLTREINALARHFERSPWNITWRFCVKPMVPEPARKFWRILHRRNQPVWASEMILKPDFVQRICLASRYHDLLRGQCTPARTSMEDHRRRLSSGMLSFVLELADRAAAAFSVEPRYPFFDRRLVEFCLSLPPEQKLSEGWTRVVMRRAMTNLLPPEVQWRGGKSDLSPNFVRGLLKFERTAVENVILNDPAAIEDYVDLGSLRSVCNRYLTRHTQQDACTVWRALTLAVWLRETGLSP